MVEKPKTFQLPQPHMSHAYDNVHEFWKFDLEGKKKIRIPHFGWVKK